MMPIRSLEKLNEGIIYTFDIFFIDASVYRVEIPAAYYNSMTSSVVHHLLASGVDPENRKPFDKEVFGYQFHDGFEYHPFVVALSSSSLNSESYSDPSRGGDLNETE